MSESAETESSIRLPEYFERESFTDCADKRREFELSIYALANHGFSGFAREVTQRDDGGYVFRSSAEGSLTIALARLRGKVQAGLAQRFLIRHEGVLEMPLERLKGRIDCDGVVVDGQLLDWSALQKLLSAYEGWEFELKIPFESER
jgi:hypothetical protein